MNADDLHRRVAAWLLTLPGPVDAADHNAARRKACRQCDPRISEEQFEGALRALGYALRPVRQAGFAIQLET